MLNRAAAREKTLGLYIHIPFCHAKCDYCDFYSLANSEDKMDAYAEALEKHLLEVAPRAACHTVDTIYFGGGTPSYFGAKRLVKILKLIKKHYRVHTSAEITLEANPDSACDWHELRSLRRAGFNRISLGVQSTDDEMLRRIGRIHSWEQVQQAVAAVRKAKIINLSLDLIYGLPGQTMEQWKKTLADALALQPEHLSCYGLKVEEGTPLYLRREREDFPNDDMQADMYLYAVEHLKNNGFAQYEISNFAIPGFESRHNLKYWTLGEYAGFGPGAHSDFGGVRYGYAKDLASYMEGKLTLSESERIAPLDRDMEYIMLRLRTSLGLDPKEFESCFRERFTPMEHHLLEYAEHGFVRREEDRWCLTPWGYLVSNRIIAQLQEDLLAEKARRMAEAAKGNFRIV